MISERQISGLLEECERALGHPLPGLRSRLLRHDNFTASLWELASLFVCVKSQLNVTYEPAPAHPDLRIANPDAEPFWIEVTSVSPRSRAATAALRRFHTWIFEQAKKQGFIGPGAEIRIDELDATHEISMPPDNQWPRLSRSDSGNRFFYDVTKTGHGVWIDHDNNFKIRFTRLESETLSGGYPVLGIPKAIRDHPVYRSIKSKADQIKSKWDDSVRADPIVLVIGAEDQSSEFNLRDARVGLEHAVNAALLDPRKLTFIERYNNLGNRYFTEIKSDRVAGAKWISAVLFVNLIARYSLGYGPTTRESKSTFFENIHAENRLTHRQREIILAIDFNQIQYGPEWEAWRKESANIPPHLRYRKRGGSLSMGTTTNGGFYMEIPSATLTRVLSGDLSAQDAFGGRDDLFLKRLHGALTENRRIESIDIVDPSSHGRGEQFVKIHFGPIRPTVIADKS